MVLLDHDRSNKSVTEESDPDSDFLDEIRENDEDNVEVSMAYNNLPNDELNPKEKIDPLQKPIRKRVAVRS